MRSGADRFGKEADIGKRSYQFKSTAGVSNRSHQFGLGLPLVLTFLWILLHVIAFREKS